MTPMTQKRLDDMEDERMRMPPYEQRNPEVMRTDHEVLNDLGWIYPVVAVLFYGAIIGLGVLVGWVVWG